MSESFEFTVNGVACSHRGDPMERLLDVLREELRATGTKEGCGEGECGACAVLVDGQLACSCLVPVFQVAGREVRTVEGLSVDGRLDSLQSAMVAAGGVQCGACTPGIVITLRALLDRDAHPSREAVREALAGNLCRCTGYERILRAVETLIAEPGANPGGAS